MPGEGWHEMVLAWKAGKARLAVDGQPAGEIAIRPLGLEPFDSPKAALCVLRRGGNVSAIDDLRMHGTAQ